MKKLIVSWGLALCALASAMPARAALTVYLDPSTVTVGTTAAFSVDVKVSGLTAGDNVSGFDLNLLFNGSVIAGTGATENGPLFGVFRAFGPVTIAAGNLGLEGTSFEFDADLIALQNPGSDAIVADFTIATFNFISGPLDGATRIDFGRVAPFESNVLGLLDVNFEATTHDAVFVGACVVVGTQGGTCGLQVPEPPSAALVGLAMLAALTPGALRRRRDQKSAR